MERAGERRWSRGRFVMVERRHGFDRRASDSPVDRSLAILRDSSGVLLGVLIAINAMNVLDFLFTVGALEAGHAEGNPIMALMFSRGPVAAGGFKILCVAAVSIVVWRMRSYRRILEVALFALIVFVAVVLFQVYGHALYY